MSESMPASGLRPTERASELAGMMMERGTLLRAFKEGGEREGGREEILFNQLRRQRPSCRHITVGMLDFYRTLPVRG